jgi:hypothetical protein
MLAFRNGGVLREDAAGMAKRCSTRRLSRFAPLKRACWIFTGETMKQLPFRDQAENAPDLPYRRRFAIPGRSSCQTVNQFCIFGNELCCCDSAAKRRQHGAVGVNPRTGSANHARSSGRARFHPSRKSARGLAGAAPSQPRALPNSPAFPSQK